LSTLSRLPFSRGFQSRSYSTTTNMPTATSSRRPPTRRSRFVSMLRHYQSTTWPGVARFAPICILILFLISTAQLVIGSIIGRLLFHLPKIAVCGQYEDQPDQHILFPLTLRDHDPHGQIPDFSVDGRPAKWCVPLQIINTATC
jgi:hypothetical protein